METSPTVTVSIRRKWLVFPLGLAYYCTRLTVFSRLITRLCLSIDNG